MDRQAYNYKPIDFGSDAIRLVRIMKGVSPSHIECKVVETRLHKVGDTYDALSYCWGGTEEPAQIILDGCRANVTQNLFGAMERLRSPDEDRLFWIDALCIDQTNKTEKSHQVSQMGSIYNCARQVYIWLGSSNTEIDLLMDVMSVIHEQLCTDDNGTQGNSWERVWQVVQTHMEVCHDKLKVALQKFLQRPWFDRVWVVQEIGRARVATIICGSKSAPTSVFVQMLRLLNETPDQNIQALLEIMPGSCRNSRERSPHSLRTLLQKFSSRKATDHRDNIYALLGISFDAHDPEIFPLSYQKTPHEVVQDAISFLLFGECVDISMNELPPWDFLDLVGEINDLHQSVFKWALREFHEGTLLKLIATGRIDINRRSFDLSPRYDGFGTPLAFLAINRGPINVITALLARPEVLPNLDSPLVKAATCGHDGMVRLLLAHEAVDVNLGSPLSKAAENGCLSVVELLLAHESIQVNFGSPLAQAAAGGHDAVVSLLLVGKGVDIDRGFPLIRAVQADHDTTVELFLEKANATLELDNLFCTAAASGSDSVLRLLMARETVVDLQRPLIQAIKNRKRSTIEFLLNYREHIKDPSPALAQALEICDEETALLMISCGDGKGLKDVPGRADELWCREVTMSFITKCMDLNHQDKDGRSLLSKAAEMGRVEIAEMLLKGGATIDMMDDSGRTPLSWAVSVNVLDYDDSHLADDEDFQFCKDQGALSKARVAEILLERGAKVDLKDKNGRTPLSWASQTGALTQALLVEKGADVDSQDNDRTPLSWAAERGQVQAADYLLSSGANIMSRDINGRTVLSWASSNGYTQITRLLLDYGAGENEEDTIALQFVEKADMAQVYHEYHDERIGTKRRRL